MHLLATTPLAWLAAGALASCSDPPSPSSDATDAIAEAADAAGDTEDAREDGPGDVSADRVADADAEGFGDAGEPFGESPCGRCVREHCATQLAACDRVADCAAFFGCLFACPAPGGRLDLACRAACPDPTTSAGLAAEQAVDLCAGSGACAADCS